MNDALIAKFPNYNPEWDPTVQAEWFRSFAQLCRTLKLEPKEASNRLPKAPTPARPPEQPAKNRGPWPTLERVNLNDPYRTLNCERSEKIEITLKECLLFQRKWRVDCEDVSIANASLKECRGCKHMVKFQSDLLAAAKGLL